MVDAVESQLFEIGEALPMILFAVVFLSVLLLFTDSTHRQTLEITGTIQNAMGSVSAQSTQVLIEIPPREDFEITYEEGTLSVRNEDVLIERTISGKELDIDSNPITGVTVITS